MKQVKILGIKFDVLTSEEVLKKISQLFEAKHAEKKYIVTPNPEILLEAEKKSEFKQILNNAYISIPDGIGILWTSTFFEITKRNKSRLIIFIKAIFSLLTLLFSPKFCRKVFKERVTGVDLMQKIIKFSANKSIKIFLLGAREGIAEKVKKILEEKYQNLDVCGAFAGSPREIDFEAIKQKIASSKPQILFVAYGAPSQELWIAKHLKELESVKLAMGVGGAFDFIAGARKRAPLWMRYSGLEWLYRLIQEPKRIKRIWNAIIVFPYKILKTKFIF